MTTAVAPNPATLPSPADRPDADVVVYDGDCSMCTAQVAKLQRWDSAGRLAYLSLHDPEVQRRWPDMSHERLMTEMAVVDRHGERHWGPEAIRYLTRRLPRLWWAVPFTYFPGSMLLGRPLYRWIARNRYRFSGSACDTGGCKVHGR
jgi:predicted DCC family thiol-disulfide oxidoreductase YuxK